METVFGLLGQCAGFNGGLNSSLLVDDPAAIPFEFAFDGITCDWGGGFEGFCSAGRFEWHLGGTVGGITFEDATLSMRGVMRVGQAAGTCPAE